MDYNSRFQPLGRHHGGIHRNYAPHKGPANGAARFVEPLEDPLGWGKMRDYQEGAIPQRKRRTAPGYDECGPPLSRRVTEAVSPPSPADHSYDEYCSPHPRRATVTVPYGQGQQQEALTDSPSGEPQSYLHRHPVANPKFRFKSVSSRPLRALPDQAQTHPVLTSDAPPSRRLQPSESPNAAHYGGARIKRKGRKWEKNMYTTGPGQLLSFDKNKKKKTNRDLEQTEHIKPGNEVGASKQLFHGSAQLPAKALLPDGARSGSDCASAGCLSATFGARDALAHINTHRDYILEPLGVQLPTSIVLAGFNEAYIREGIGLLQEIHIMVLTDEDIELDESVLAGVGKACSPFPGVIYMPSGRGVRSPLYNQNGQMVPFSVLGGFVCKLRHSIAVDKGLTVSDPGRDEDHSQVGTSSSHHAIGSQEALPPSIQPGEATQPAIGTGRNGSNRSTSVGEDERRTFHAQDSTRDIAAREVSPRRRDPDALGQDPPDPDNGASTKHLRSIFLKLLLEIRPKSGEDISFGQNIQLQAAFGFQLDPGRSTTVQFTELVCSGATTGSRQHQPHYLHKYLKVLVDVQSDNWKTVCCLPRRTPAGQREIKDLDTHKNAKQGGIKFKGALIPEANLEGTLTSENSKASERVRYISGIRQENWLGEYTWGFDVDDEREQRQGLQLCANRLPKLSLDYLQDARQPLENSLPEELTIEISAFWSLNPPTSNGWLWWQTHGQCPPQYSNLVHSVRVDLPVDMDCDGHFVGEQKIGGGVPESRRVKTLSPLGILVSTGIQLPGKQSPEGFPRWLPRSMG